MKPTANPETIQLSLRQQFLRILIRKVPSLKSDDEICYCFHITRRKIFNFIRIYKPRRPSQISECGGAGTGCGWCIPFLKKYHTQMQDTEDTAEDDITPEEYARQRGAYIREGHGTPPPGATPPPKTDIKDQQNFSL